MSKTIEIPDIAQYEETDSELAKYSIQELTSLVIKFKEQNKQLVNVILNQDKIIDKAIEILKLCNSKCAKETIDILRGKDNVKD